MAVPLLKADDAPQAEPPLLGLVRMSALDCRAAARAEATACAAIDPAARPDVLATQLVKMLPQFLKRRPVLWRPGTRGMSFDEAWLLALDRAVRRGDRDSERFLLSSRIDAASLHSARTLVRGLIRRTQTTI
ncbi:hypothetical protein EU805_16255 [Salipiger sp. IMCC34102]|uniref:hypothetical protein n=1 Tax=Salipiger sp. IMCC34102 TaxID=2510647 RepID=UPI00101CEF46|nr:hypothetical protein [Salipiger sp. IMCC34102]RYH00868.1 hypothetical protein EU805_16255 [Salipiger sp. IMCC34102]